MKVSQIYDNQFYKSYVHWFVARLQKTQMYVLRFRDFLFIMSFFFSLNICSVTQFVRMSIHDFFAFFIVICFATYGCWHPYLFAIVDVKSTAYMNVVICGGECISNFYPLKIRKRTYQGTLMIMERGRSDRVPFSRGQA